MSSRKRRWLIVPIVIVLVPVVAVVVLNLVFTEQKLRELVLPRASKALGRPVDCGHIGFGLTRSGLSLVLEDLTLGEDSLTFGLRGLQLPSLNAGVAWGPLLRKRVEVTRLELVGLRAELLLPEPGAAPAPAAAKAKATAPAAIALVIPDLRLRDASVHVKQPPATDVEISIPDASISADLQANGDASFRADARIDAIRMSGPEGLRADAAARLELSAGIVDGRIMIENALMTVESWSLSGKDKAGAAFGLGGGEMTIALSGDAPLDPAADGALPPALRGTATATAIIVQPQAGEEGLRKGVVPRVEMEFAVDSARPEELRILRLFVKDPEFEMALPPVRKPGDEAPAGRAPASAAGPLLPAGALALSCSDLEVRGGRMKIVQQGGPSVEAGFVAKIEGSLTPAAGLAAKLWLNLEPIEFGQAGLMKGTSRANGEMTMRLDEDALTIDSAVLDITSLELNLSPPDAEPARIAGAGATVTLSGRIPVAMLLAPDPQAAPPPLRVEVEVKPLVVQSAALAKPLQVQEARLSGGLELLTLQTLRAIAGESSLNVSGELRLHPEPSMKLSLRSPLLNLADFVVPPPEKGAPAGAAAGAAAGKTAPMIPPLLPGTLEFRVDRLVAEKAVVTELSGRLLASVDGLDLENLKGKLFGGTMQGAIKLKALPDGAAASEGTIGLSNLRGAEFLKAFTPVQGGLDGGLNGRFDFTATLRPQQKPKDLNLDGEIDLRHGQLDTPPALTDLLGKLGVQARKNYALEQVRQLLEVRGDRVHTEKVELGLAEGTLRASGSAGLDGSLDYRGTWMLEKATVDRLPKDSPIRLLADKDGRFPLDFKLSGSYGKPKVEVDLAALQARAEEIVKKRLQDELNDQKDDLVKKAKEGLGKLLR